jgi:hypothetical protein
VPYFARDDVAVIELTLREYQKIGYLKYRKRSEGEFEILEINSQKATDDLLEYLALWQNDQLALLTAKKLASSAHQQELLTNALAHAYRLNPQDHQRITLEDIYGSPNSDIFGTPFWELILSLHFSERPEAMIKRIGYDRSMSGLYADNAQPFAEIKITSSEKLRFIELAAKSSEPISDEEPQELEYNGLRFNRDESISYKGVSIDLSPQEAAVIRVFLTRPEEWRSDDAFTAPSADVFVGGTTHANLSKLISQTRVKLNAAIGNDQNAIINKRDRGWKLKIQLAE